MVPAVPSEFAPVKVDRVTWVPAAGGTVEVTIEGTWRGTPLPTTPLLLVEEAGLRRRFGARGEARPAPVGAFRAAFSLPLRLCDELRAGAAMRLGATEMALPAARVGLVVDAGGQLIGPAVLEDRRARARPDEPPALAHRLEIEREARAVVEAERDALATEVAAARGRGAGTGGVEVQELKLLRARVDDLNDALARLAGELRVRLRDETAARWVAEAELRTERAHVGALQAEVATMSRQPARAAAAGAPPEHAPPPDAEATIANLGRAADRLRERAQRLALDADLPVAPLASRGDQIPPPERAPETSVPGASESAPPPELPVNEELAALATPPRREDDEDATPEAVVDVDGITVELDEITPERFGVVSVAEALPTTRAPASAPVRTERVIELAPRIVNDQLFTYWMTDALQQLDRVHRAAAARAVVALLPMQGRAVRRKLTYDMTVEDGGTHRIVLADRVATITARRDDDGLAASKLAVAGTPGALAPLVTGGTWRGMKDVEVTGRRRRLKRVARRRRRPVTLGQVATAGIEFDPGLALRLLAMAVEPGWTSGYFFHVGYRVTRGDEWLVRVSDGRRPLVTDESERTATAWVEAPSNAALLAHLSRTEPPAEAPTTVGGDPAAFASLQRWFDRAQGFHVL